MELQQPSLAPVTDSTPRYTTQSVESDVVLTVSSNLTERTVDRPADAIPAIPDGGRSAWTIVFTSAIFTFWFNGIGNSWGVMQAALSKQGLASTSTLSFVGSLSITLAVFLSLLSVRFMHLVSARWTGLIGIIISYYTAWTWRVKCRFHDFKRRRLIRNHRPPVRHWY